MDLYQTELGNKSIYKQANDTVGETNALESGYASNENDLIILHSFTFIKKSGDSISCRQTTLKSRFDPTKELNEFHEFFC